MLSCYYCCTTKNGLNYSELNVLKAFAYKNLCKHLKVYDWGPSENMSRPILQGEVGSVHRFKEKGLPERHNSKSKVEIWVENSILKSPFP